MQELEVMKVVGEGLKTMCSSIEQQLQVTKEEKDEDDLFGVFVGSPYKKFSISFLLYTYFIAIIPISILF